MPLEVIDGLFTCIEIETAQLWAPRPQIPGMEPPVYHKRTMNKEKKQTISTKEVVLGFFRF